MKSYLAKGTGGDTCTGYNHLDAAAGLTSEEFELFYFDPKKVVKFWVNADGSVGVEWLASLPTEDREMWPNDFRVGRYTTEDGYLRKLEDRVDTK